MGIIKKGGQVKSLQNNEKIEHISFVHEDGRQISLWINESSLSYLTIEEALNLRDDLNNAIKQAAGLWT